MLAMTACSRPSVEGGCPKYTQYSSLWDSMLDGTVVLVKGKWLEEQCSLEETAMPRRQDMPPEALWRPEKLIGRYENPRPNRRPPNLIVVSYCWLSRDHPDPHGRQMRLLGRVLAWSHACPFRSKETAVFIDWCSLYQAPRTPEQTEVFGNALKYHINVWYAHAKTDVLMLTDVPADIELARPYYDRGWPTFEYRVSGLISQFRVSGDSGVYDIGRLSESQVSAKCTAESWRAMHKACVKGFSPPVTPDVFNRILGEKAFTCPAHDMLFCQQKYAEVFEETTAGATELLYQGLEWGDKEVEELVGIFPNCRSLLMLNLRDNWIGDAGARCLAKVLPRTLKHLSFRDNQIGDLGIEELSKELAGRRCPNLRVVNLSGNVFGDGGLEFLADAVARCAVLQHLYLAQNRFRDAGILKLSDALGKCEHLQRLDLEGNPVQASTADTVRWTWLKHGKVQEGLIVTTCDDALGDGDEVDAEDGTRSERVPLAALRNAVSKASQVQRTYLKETLALGALPSMKACNGGLSNSLTRAFNQSVFEAMEPGQAIQHIVVKLKDNTDTENQIEAAKAVQVLARVSVTQERLAENNVIPDLVNLLSALYTPLRAAVAGAIRSLVHGNQECRRLAVLHGAIPALVKQLTSSYPELLENAAMALWSLSSGNYTSEFVTAKAIPAIVQFLTRPGNSCVLQKASVGLILYLAGDSSAQPLMISAGIVPALVNILAKEDCCVREPVLGALKRLIEGQRANEKLVPVCIDAGAFPVLVEHLKAESARQQEAATKALCGLTRDSPVARRFAVKHGALNANAAPALLDSLSESVQLLGLDVLWNLTGEASAMLHLVGTEVPRLVLALRFRVTEVKAEAARVMQQALDTEEKRSEAVDIGAVQTVVDMLGSRGEDLQLASIGLLRTLALSRDAKVIALESGAVPLLNDLLYSRNQELLDLTARALRNLATNNDVKVAAGKAVPTLCGLMRVECPDVLEAVLGALRNLLYRNGANKQKAMCAKCLTGLIASMQSDFLAVKVQAVGAVVNLVSTSDDAAFSKHVQQEAAAAGAPAVLEAMLAHEEKRLSEQAERALAFIMSTTARSSLPPLTPGASAWTTTRTRKSGSLGSPLHRKTVHMPRHGSRTGL